MKKYAIAIIVFLICRSTMGNATTLIVIVNGDSIFFAADSVQSAKDDKGSWRVVGTTQKFFVIQQRIAFASFGYNFVPGPDIGLGRMVYDFPGFAERLERAIPAGIDVSGFADAVEGYTRVDAPKFLDPLINAGNISREAVGPSDIIFGYVIAGYEGKTPTIIRIVYKVDWGARCLTGPFRTKEFPGETAADFTMYCDAMCNAVRAIGTGTGQWYALARRRYPNDIDIFVHKTRLPSAIESIHLICAMMEVEAIANKNRVGLPIRIVTIPQTGSTSTSILSKWGGEAIRQPSYKPNADQQR